MPPDRSKPIVLTYIAVAVGCLVALVNIPTTFEPLWFGWPSSLLWTLGWMALAFGALTAMHLLLGEEDDS